jgi:hypothetical protein
MANTSTQAAVQLAMTVYNAMDRDARRHTSLENVIATVQTMFALNMTIGREHVAMPAVQESVVLREQRERLSIVG